MAMSQGRGVQSKGGKENKRSVDIFRAVILKLTCFCFSAALPPYGPVEILKAGATVFFLNHRSRASDFYQGLLSLQAWRGVWHKIEDTINCSLGQLSSNLNSVRETDHWIIPLEGKQK